MLNQPSSLPTHQILLLSSCPRFHALIWVGRCGLVFGPLYLTVVPKLGPMLASYMAVPKKCGRGIDTAMKSIRNRCSVYWRAVFRLSARTKKERGCRSLSSKVLSTSHRSQRKLSPITIPDHPFFMGFQAHPELCSRPLNPSPPFLGFIAASCGQSDLEEQIQEQLRSFRPPHPEHSMISEEALRKSTQEHPIVNGVGTMTPPAD
jgi:hypothetical protein